MEAKEQTISFDQAYEILTKSQMKPGELESLIPKLGFNHPTHFGNFATGGLKLQQIPKELAGLAKLLGEKFKGKKINYIEIGIGDCGTMLFLNEFFKKNNIDATIWGIDNLLYEALGSLSSQSESVELAKKKIGANIVLVNTASPDFKKFLTGKSFDVIFIDGDHSYEGVVRDFLATLPHLKKDGIVIFHDIASENCPGVVNGFKNIKKYFKESHEIIHTNKCGIGACSNLKKELSQDDIMNLLIWDKAGDSQNPDVLQVEDILKSRNKLIDDLKINNDKLNSDNQKLNSDNQILSNTNVKLTREQSAINGTYNFISKKLYDKINNYEAELTYITEIEKREKSGLYQTINAKDKNLEDKINVSKFANLDFVQGFLDEPTLTENNTVTINQANLRITGWAFDKILQRPLNLKFIINGNEITPFPIKRNDVYELYKNDYPRLNALCGFQANFNITEEHTKISTYIVDAEDKEIFIGNINVKCSLDLFETKNLPKEPDPNSKLISIVQPPFFAPNSNSFNNILFETKIDINRLNIYAQNLVGITYENEDTIKHKFTAEQTKEQNVYKICADKEIEEGIYLLHFTDKIKNEIIAKNIINLVQDNFDNKKFLEQMNQERLTKRKTNKIPTNKNRFSITCTVYDTPINFVEKLAQCIEEQTIQNYEWLILDNGSKNRQCIRYLKKLACQNKKIKLFRVKKNIGILQGNRYLLEKAKNTWIVPIDSDDLIAKDSLETFSEYINQYPDARLFYSYEQKIDILDEPREFIWRQEPSKLLPIATCPAAHFQIFHRSTALKYNVYSDKCAETSHDWDTYLRFIDAGKKVQKIPYILYSWRMHMSSTALNTESKSNKKIMAGHIKLIKKSLERKKLKNLYKINSVKKAITYFYHLDRIQKKLPQSLLVMVLEEDYQLENFISNLYFSNRFQMETIALISNNCTYGTDEIQRIFKVMAYSAPFTTHKCNIKNKNEFKPIIQKQLKEHHLAIAFINSSVKLIEEKWLNDATACLELDENIGIVGGLLTDKFKTFKYSSYIKEKNNFPEHFTLVNSRYKENEVSELLVLGSVGLFPLYKHNVYAINSTIFLLRSKLINQDIFPEKLGFDKYGLNGIELSLKLKKLNYESAHAPALHAECNQEIPCPSTAPKEKIQHLIDNYQILSHKDPYYSKYLEAPQVKPWNHYNLIRNYNLQQRANKYKPTTATKEIIFSFVTSAYNTKPEFLHELANCVFNQEYQDEIKFEWILLDNGSENQDTIETIKSIAQNQLVKYSRVEKNLGIIGGARHTLLEANGKYILPLDSDDLLTKDCIKILYHFAQKNNFPALMFSDEDKYEGKTKEFLQPFHKPKWDFPFFIDCCYIAHLCAIDRKLALEYNCYTDKIFDGSHDWSTFMTFYLKGHTPAHVPETIYSWRLHKQSTSANITSKSYIEVAQKAVLKMFIDSLKNKDDYKLTRSKFFNNTENWQKKTPDWHIKRLHQNPKKIHSIIETGTAKAEEPKQTQAEKHHKITHIKKGELLRFLQNNLKEICPNTDIIHLQNAEYKFLYPDWAWEAIAMFELYPNIGIAGGPTINQNDFFENYRDKKKSLTSFNAPGDFAQNWKHITVRKIDANNLFMLPDLLKKFVEKKLEKLEKLGKDKNKLSKKLAKFANQNQLTCVRSPFLATKKQTLT